MSDGGIKDVEHYEECQTTGSLDALELSPTSPESPSDTQPQSPSDTQPESPSDTQPESSTLMPSKVGENLHKSDCFYTKFFMLIGIKFKK